MMQLRKITTITVWQISLAISMILSFALEPAKGQSYSWGNVSIGGGGFVSAIITSKTEKDLIYARTDVGGAYRWDNVNGQWIPLLDWVSEDELGYLGVESLAIDPQQPNKLYLLVGTSYFNAGKTAILRSDDYGETFSVTEVTSQFKAHGNGMGRQNGERLAVDPNYPDILFCGTRWNGLFKSTNAGISWSRVAALDVTTTPNENGISFVVLDSLSSEAGSPTQTIFTGVSRTGTNLYKSDDGGESFTPVAGAPTDLMPQRAVLDGSGNLYITYANGAGPHGHWAVPEPMDEGKIWKYNIGNGSWTDVTPAGFTNAFGGITVDPGNPERIVASTMNTWLYQDNAYGDRIFISSDGGSTWTDVVERGFQLDNNGFGWIDGQSIHWTGSVEFDPFDTKKVWITSGNGVYSTDDIDAATNVWQFKAKGLEETVPLDLVSIPNGPVISVIADYDGFVHWDITQPGAIHKPGMGTTTGLAYAAQNPNILLRFGNEMYYSIDMGESWTQCPSEGIKGKVAISADGQTFLSCAEDSNTTYWSDDRGASWNTANGLTFSNVRPVADPVNSNKFYAYNSNTGKLFVSNDKGRSFELTGSPGSGGSRVIRMVVGHEGHLWVALYNGGLTRSTDSGASFLPIDNVSYCGAVGIGKEAPGAAYPTIFIWGIVNNELGLYRSADEGVSWTRINDDAHQFGGPGNGQFVAGDMNVYGRVYMSTAGRGIVYGEADDTCIPDFFEPYIQVGDQSPQSVTHIIVEGGETVKLGADASGVGSWIWTGPDGFTSGDHEVILEGIEYHQTGIYTVKHINETGCVSAGQTFTIHMDQVVAGTGKISKKKSLQAFPNPSDGNMTILFPHKGFEDITVTDLNGRSLLRIPLSKSLDQIHINPALSRGFYIIRLESDEEVLQTKIFIE